MSASLIEYVRKIQRGEIPGPTIAQTLQITITQVEDGRLTMQMPIDARFANPAGTLHGGVLCDLGDAAMGTAFATTCEAEESYATIELKCNFLRPVWKGLLTANAWVVSRGKNIGLVECEILDESNRLIAKLSSTLTVLRGEAAKNRTITPA